MTSGRRIFYTLCLSLICYPACSQAELVEYSSGTGFFVNREGYVLTNNHVIEHCGGINVHSENLSMDANLVAVDKDDDLALLKTVFDVPDAASLSAAAAAVKADDPVVIVGYPGVTWQNHHPIMREATIVSDKGPEGEDKWLQFSDTVVQGNSGGPLLDRSGNVVGVVVAKVKVVRYNETTDHIETVQRSDIAISLPVLRAFLDANHVLYDMAMPHGVISSARIADKARSYIVNVHCQMQ